MAAGHVSENALNDISGFWDQRDLFTVHWKNKLYLFSVQEVVTSL